MNARIEPFTDKFPFRYILEDEFLFCFTTKKEDWEKAQVHMAENHKSLMDIRNKLSMSSFTVSMKK